MELIIFGIFGCALIGCILSNLSILIALGIGFFLFFAYGLVHGFSFLQMCHLSLNGIKTVKNILLTFLLIGMLTALWRAAGTIAVIICYSSWMIQPTVFLLVSFLLNCMISFLTGTSFGTAATMGVICMTMAATMNIHPLLAGGSIMSGIFFGDRCSPVSTSALLVSELTKTDIYQNIRKMITTAAVPFTITCIFYLLIGFFLPHGDGSMNIRLLFSQAFVLHWKALLPAAVILLLSLFRIRVKTTMLISIVVAVSIGIFIQKISAAELLRLMFLGYRAPTAEVGAMLNGGGIISMLRVSAIVCLSSSYAGIFEGTHMLDKIRNKIAELGNYIPAFGGILGVSILTSAISCNQTLSIMLTHQLCEKLEPNSDKMAIHLENAPVLIAPLIPWSIAGAVPVAAIGAPGLCLVSACYLYLVPIWNLLIAYRNNPKN